MVNCQQFIKNTEGGVMNWIVYLVCIFILDFVVGITMIFLGMPNVVVIGFGIFLYVMLVFVEILERKHEGYDNKREFKNENH
jgi:hypothetical protein